MTISANAIKQCSAESSISKGCPHAVRFARNYEVPPIGMPDYCCIVHKFGRAAVTSLCQFRDSTREEGNLLGVDFGNQTVDGVGRGNRRVGRDWPYLDRTILARGSLWCRKDNEDASK